MDALDVSKKVLQFKLQLKETTESKKVLKILKKLRELDITLDILAETGIGKAVNSLRKHGDAGEAVRLLVSHWKKLVPKETLSHTEKDASQSKLLVTDAEIQNCSKEACSKIEDRSQNASEDERLKTDEDNQDGPTSRGVHLKTDEKNKGTSEKEHLKTDRNEESLETEYKNQGTSKDEHLKTEDKNQGTAEMSHLQEVDEDSSELKNDHFKSEKENKRTWKKDKDEGKKQKGTRECLMVTGKKSNWSRKSEDENVLLPNTTFSSKSSHKKAKSISREESNNNSDNGGKCGIRRDSNRETLPCPKPSSDESSKSKPDRKWTVIDKSNDQDNKKASDSLGCNGEKRKPIERKQVCHDDKNTKQEGKSKTKEKMAIEDKPNGSDVEVPSMSFESFLSYDINTPKRKKTSESKKTPKKLKTVEKEVKVVKTPSTKSNKQLPAATADFSLPKKAMKGSVMDLLNIPLPTFLPEYDELSNFNYYDRKMEDKSKVLVSEGPVFTGQRLNRKMQVYSGAKSAFLPTMMSLYQQCIRALQNNIDLLYEIGGVPFEILEPVLERCTPDQLFRIEECNPMYVGLTDHLWEKHCQRDFRNAQLEEYESWREMHMRLSEERERKLQRLTKTIVSAHSGKPKGRQVKMAFINSVAKPPRNVRIQQEIHGTARHPRIQQENNGPTGVVLPPHPLDRPSVKAQENRARPCYVEPPRPSTTVSGTSQGQDSRKKTRVAPMMAKSLKAFKTMGRR